MISKKKDKDKEKSSSKRASLGSAPTAATPSPAPTFGAMRAAPSSDAGLAYAHSSPQLSTIYATNPYTPMPPAPVYAHMPSAPTTPYTTTIGNPYATVHSTNSSASPSPYAAPNPSATAPATRAMPPHSYPTTPAAHSTLAQPQPHPPAPALATATATVTPPPRPTTAPPPRPKSSPGMSVPAPVLPQGAPSGKWRFPVDPRTGVAVLPPHDRMKVRDTFTLVRVLPETRTVLLLDEAHAHAPLPTPLTSITLSEKRRLAVKVKVRHHLHILDAKDKLLGDIPFFTAAPLALWRDALEDLIAGQSPDTPPSPTASSAQVAEARFEFVPPPAPAESASGDFPLLAFKEGELFALLAAPPASYPALRGWRWARRASGVPTEGYVPETFLHICAADDPQLAPNLAQFAVTMGLRDPSTLPAPSSASASSGSKGGALRRSRSTGNIVTVSEPIAASAAAHAPQPLRATQPVPVLNVNIIWERRNAAPVDLSVAKLLEDAFQARASFLEAVFDTAPHVVDLKSMMAYQIEPALTLLSHGKGARIGIARQSFLAATTDQLSFNAGDFLLLSATDSAHIVKRKGVVPETLLELHRVDNVAATAAPRPVALFAVLSGLFLVKVQFALRRLDLTHPASAPTASASLASPAPASHAPVPAPVPGLVPASVASAQPLPTQPAPPAVSPLMAYPDAGDVTVPPKMWYWQGDDGSFVAFDSPENTAACTQAFLTDRSSLEISKGIYVVDLINMEQVRKETKKTRQISNDLIQAFGRDKYVAWSWYDGQGFQPYPPKIIFLINRMLATHKTPLFRVNMNGVWYLMDTIQFVQVHIPSNSPRPIRSGHTSQTTHALPLTAPLPSTSPSRRPGVPAAATATSSSSFIPLRMETSASGPNLQIIDLPPHNEEYRKTQATKTILSIRKIVNRRLQMLFDLELDMVRTKNASDPSLELVKLLFHGTSKTEPSLIYNGEKGFMMQFAAEGMWGRGTYFAEKASYSDSYAFKTPRGEKQMFLAEVIVGDSYYCESDRSLRLPPVRPSKSKDVNFAQERYDSVSGFTNGSKVYIVYENNKAYPAFLITYK